MHETNFPDRGTQPPTCERDALRLAREIIKYGLLSVFAWRSWADSRHLEFQDPPGADSKVFHVT